MKSKDHEHCSPETTCWQGSYKCPEGGKNPLKDTVTFEVRHDLSKPGGALITRTRNRCAGWSWVRYAGRRYQLYGGIRTAFFVNLKNPLP